MALRKPRRSNPRRQPLPSREEMAGIVAEALAPGNFERMMDRLRQGQDIDSLALLTMFRNPSESARQLLEAVLADPKVRELVEREQRKYDREESAWGGSE